MALELRTEPYWVRLRRDRPLQRQGMIVPGEAFAATQKRKKVVTRSLLLAFVLLFKDESFFIFTEGEKMKHLLKRLVKANYRFERM